MVLLSVAASQLDGVVPGVGFEQVLGLLGRDGCSLFEQGLLDGLVLKVVFAGV